MDEETGALTRDPAARRLDIVTLIVIAGTSASAIMHYVYGTYLQRPYPLNTFLFVPLDRFNDFLNCLFDARTFNTTDHLLRWVYTPVLHLILVAEIKLGQLVAATPVGILWFTIAAFLALFAWFLARFFTRPGAPLAVNAQRVIALSALSYPVLFLLDRGNTEMFVLAAVLGFVYFYFVKPKTWLWVLFLALAASMKLYPLTLLLIPLSDRRYRDTLYAVLATAAAMLIGFVLIGFASGFGFPKVVPMWIGFMELEHATEAAISWMGVQHGHSLWGAVFVANAASGTPFALPVLKSAYIVLALACAAAAAAWMFFGRLEPWQKLAVAVFLYLLLPFSSHDYTLVHVYFPLALFVASREQQRFERTLAVLFAALLIPLDYYYFFQSPGLWPRELMGAFPMHQASDFAALTSVSVVLYPAILVAILVLIGLSAPKGRRRAAAGAEG